MPDVEDQVVETEKPVAKTKEPETVTLTKAEVEALRRERDEFKTDAQFWAQRARGGKETAREPEDDPVDTAGLVPEVTGDADIDAAIFSDPAKWTEAITQGPKAIGQYIKSLGLVSGAEAAEIAIRAARQVVKGTVQGMQTDQQLTSDYADLKDNKSELFKTTAPIYQKLVAMNGGKESSALLYAAAGQAKAVIDAKAPAAPKRRPADDDEYDRYDPDEDDRRARADAQGARRGRPAPIEDETSDMIGPEAKAICQQMDVKEEDYLKSQKDLGTRRRR